MKNAAFPIEPLLVACYLSGETGVSVRPAINYRAAILIQLYILTQGTVSDKMYSGSKLQLIY